MWYKCEVMGQSNQVHQLKLLQKIILIKNAWFCEYMSKSKNAKSCNVNHIPLTKMSHFQSFWVELCKTLERDGQEIKISTRMKKFHFWVKYTLLITWSRLWLAGVRECPTWWSVVGATLTVHQFFCILHYQKRKRSFEKFWFLLHMV